MTTHYILTEITIDGRAFIRERYVPRTQEEAHRRRQAQRVEARRGEQLARFRAALDRIVAAGEKAAEWPPAPDPMRMLDMVPPGGASS